MKNKIKFLTLILVCLLSVFTFVGCSENNPPTTPNYNTVTFVTNGGSAIADKSCDVISVSPTTIRNDYNFIAWYYDIYLTQIVTFPLSVDSDMTLYAKWEKTLEKLTSDCIAYIDSQPNNELFSQEDNSDSENVDVINTTVTHIGNSLELDWERGRGSVTESDNLITNEYSLNLSFDYGNLESATGYFDYIYEFHTSNGDLWSGLVASYRITSIIKTGDTYLMDGYFIMFNPVGNYSFTQEDVKSTLESNFTLALYDFQFLFPVEYWNTIFDY